MGWENTDRLGCATNQNSIFITGRNTLPLAEVNLISLYTDKSVVQHGDLEAVFFSNTRQLKNSHRRLVSAFRRKPRYGGNFFSFNRAGISSLGSRLRNTGQISRLPDHSIIS